MSHFAMLPYEGEKKVDVTFIRSSNLPEQRTRLVSQALDYGASHIMWFDSDMKFPADTIARLVNHNLHIVGANYPQKNIQARPTAYVEDDNYVGPLWTGEIATGLQQISHCGFGCLLISTEVFEALDLPFFAFTPQPPDFIRHVGEDVHFFIKAKAAGFKAFVDQDLSKQIAHIGEFEYTNQLGKQAEVTKQELYAKLPA